MGVIIIFGIIALVGWSFVAWTYTDSGKKWLKSL